MKTSIKAVLLLVVLVAFGAAPVLAQTNIIVMDEFGNGTFNGSPVLTVGSGSNLVYLFPLSLSVSFQIGTVYLSPGPGDSPCTTFDPPANPNGACDILTFINHDIAFWSAPNGAAELGARADTGFPLIESPLLTIPETGSESNNGAFYTPSTGQPGFIAGMGMTYQFVSDGTGGPPPPPVPEPSSLVLYGTGLLGLAGAARRKLFG